MKKMEQRKGGEREGEMAEKRRGEKEDNT